MCGSVGYFAIVGSRLCSVARRIMAWVGVREVSFRVCREQGEFRSPGEFVWVWGFEGYSKTLSKEGADVVEQEILRMSYMK